VQPKDLRLRQVQTKVHEVLDSLAKQSKEKIVVESTVKGNCHFTVNDVTLEAA